MARGKKRKRKAVLADHRSAGKRLVPPFVASLPNLRLASWHREQLPEVLWIGLLIDAWGLKDGSDLSVALARGATKIHSGEKKLLFAFASSYRRLSTDQLVALRSAIDGTQQLAPVQVTLEPLVRIYPAFPLSFVGMPSAQHVRLDGEERLRRVLSALFDKTSTLAMRVLATSVYIALITDKLKVPKDHGFEDLHKIADYPSASVPEFLPATIRATFGALFGSESEELKSDWSLVFWQRGFEYSTCELPRLTDE